MKKKIIVSILLLAASNQSYIFASASSEDLEFKEAVKRSQESALTDQENRELVAALALSEQERLKSLLPLGIIDAPAEIENLAPEKLNVIALLEEPELEKIKFRRKPASQILGKAAPEQAAQASKFEADNGFIRGEIVLVKNADNSGYHYEIVLLRLPKQDLWLLQSDKNSVHLERADNIGKIDERILDGLIHEPDTVAEEPEEFEEIEAPEASCSADEQEDAKNYEIINQNESE